MNRNLRMAGLELGSRVEENWSRGPGINYKFVIYAVGKLNPAEGFK